MKSLGYILIIISTIFALVETVHFGSNLLPSSQSEIVCDVIALIGLLIGSILIKFSKHENKVRIR